MNKLLKDSFLLYSTVWLSLVFLGSSIIFAEEIDTSSTAIDETADPKVTTSNNKEGNKQNAGITVAEALLTEAIWFGSEEEVTIATRHEIPVSKAPSIVTVITAEEIKHLGYRTFVEILRTVPGFEILKAGGFGNTITAVRGLVGSSKVRLMINGHLVNNPLGGRCISYL